MTAPDTASAVEYYSKIAAKFHSSYNTEVNRIERIAVWKKFIDRHGRNANLAYDLGCGSGILTCELAKRGIETIGIDGSKPMLELATLTAAQQEISNITFVRSILPLANTQLFRQADLIISSSVIEYLPSVEDALRSFRQLLRPGGVIIFSVANRLSVGRRVGRASYALTGHPQYLSVVKNLSMIKEIYRDFRSVGLQLTEYEYYEKSDGINRILRHIAPLKYASNMIIVAARKTSENN